MNKKMGYYPGCTLKSTAYEYDQSVRAVYTALDIGLEEVPDWSCCGASSAHATNASLADSLVSRNLVLAETAGFNEMVVPCAACYNLFKRASLKTRQGHDREVKVVHPLEWLSQPKILAELSECVVKPLTGLKVVTYYGCLLTRPSSIAFDNTEYPVSMDKILQTVGVEVKKWSYKVDCCGASLTLARPEVVAKIIANFVKVAVRAGAEAIVTACPLCQSNLDMRQGNVPNKMPIFYFSELIGVSFGDPAAGKWLARHIESPVPLLERLNLL